MKNIQQEAKTKTLTVNTQKCRNDAKFSRPQGEHQVEVMFEFFDPRETERE